MSAPERRVAAGRRRPGGSSLRASPAAGGGAGGGSGSAPGAACGPHGARRAALLAARVCWLATHSGHASRTFDWRGMGLRTPRPCSSSMPARGSRSSRPRSSLRGRVADGARAGGSGSSDEPLWRLGFSTLEDDRRGAAPLRSLTANGATACRFLDDGRLAAGGHARRALACSTRRRPGALSPPAGIRPGLRSGRESRWEARGGGDSAPAACSILDAESGADAPRLSRDTGTASTAWPGLARGSTTWLARARTSECSTGISPSQAHPRVLYQGDRYMTAGRDRPARSASLLTLEAHTDRDPGLIRRRPSRSCHACARRHTAPVQVLASSPTRGDVADLSSGNDARVLVWDVSSSPPWRGGEAPSMMISGSWSSPVARSSFERDPSGARGLPVGCDVHHEATRERPSRGHDRGFGRPTRAQARLLELQSSPRSAGGDGRALRRRRPGRTDLESSFAPVSRGPATASPALGGSASTPPEGLSWLAGTRPRAWRSRRVRILLD